MTAVCLRRARPHQLGSWQVVAVSAVLISSVLRACVRPSGSFGAPHWRWPLTPGSYPALLRPRLTPVCLPPVLPRMVSVPHLRARPLTRQASPGNDVNFPNTTSGFTCDADTRTSLCRASSSAPPASSPVSVRRLVGLTPASFPRSLATPQLPLSNALVFTWYLASRTFTPSVHAPAGHTPCAAANPALALWLQSVRPAGRVAELGSFGGQDGVGRGQDFPVPD